MIVFSIFIISYLNMGIFVLYQYGTFDKEAFSIPHNFTS
jgi:hypothetical protein